MIADAFIKAAYRRGRSDREKGITKNPYHKPSQTELYEAWERGNRVINVTIAPGEVIGTVGGARLAESIKLAIKRNVPNRYAK